MRKRSKITSFSNAYSKINHKNAMKRYPDCTVDMTVGSKRVKFGYFWYGSAILSKTDWLLFILISIQILGDDIDQLPRIGFGWIAQKAIF